MNQLENPTHTSTELSIGYVAYIHTACVQTIWSNIAIIIFAIHTRALQLLVYYNIHAISLEYLFMCKSNEIFPEL